MPSLCTKMPLQMAPMPCSLTPNLRFFSWYWFFWKSPYIFIRVMLEGAKSAAATTPDRQPRIKLQAVCSAHHTAISKGTWAQLNAVWVPTGKKQAQKVSKQTTRVGPKHTNEVVALRKRGKESQQKTSMHTAGFEPRTSRASPESRNDGGQGIQHGLGVQPGGNALVLGCEGGQFLVPAVWKGAVDEGLELLGLLRVF